MVIETSTSMGSAAKAVRALQRAAKQSPVDHIPWLPGQLEFLRHAGPEPVLYRAGNRQGKSTVGCAELIFRARGRHPFKTVPVAPVRLAIVCFSLVQSVEIQRVLWELLGGLDSEDLVPGQIFSPRTGFRGHRPVVEFRNGSAIHIYSNAAGAGALAGSEYSWILCDEPPAQEVFDEARARVRNTGGNVGITLTPINGPPLPWLRSLTEPGEDGSPPKVRDIHVPLTVESQISPITGLVRRTKDGRPWDEDFIATLRRLENPIDAPVRLDGEWESRSEGQWFRCFDPDQHVTALFPATSIQWYVGIDYAAADRELGMCAVLTGVEQCEEGGQSFLRLWTLAEVVVPGTTTTEVFAARILAMLDEHRFRWTELDGVYGDNPVRSRFGFNSNIEMGKWIGRKLNVNQNNLRPRVTNAKEGEANSGVRKRTKETRCKWMYHQIAANRVRIHPRCTNLLRALAEWDYGDRHPAKDVLDAWMYGLKDFWKPDQRYGQSPLRVVMR